VIAENDHAFTETAHAKVNLYLHVTGRRADGYHLLDSLAVFTELGDVLHAAPADELALLVQGPFANSLAAEQDNLVLRAARALAADAGVTAGAHLVLEKNLPVASGIGGGSADAAAALRLLCRLWRLSPDRLELARVAARLGADVPVCLAGRTARMGGIGERLEEGPLLPPCGIALVNPGIAVATANVFRRRRGAWSLPAALPAAWRNIAAMAADLAHLCNDLEQPAIALHPEIAGALAALADAPGCVLARMSGSGATCFGLFENAAMAALAVDRLRRPGWWSRSGKLRSCTSPFTSPGGATYSGKHGWGVAKG
jgi:4-diphosphocytidyl-2-C-methyl-D-erythritol kinase